MKCPEVESIKTSSQVAQLLKIQSAFFSSQADYRSKSSPVSTIVFFWGSLSLCILCKFISVNFQDFWRFLGRDILFKLFKSSPVPCIVIDVYSVSKQTHINNKQNKIRQNE